MQVVGGIDRDIKKKIELKRDAAREAACMEWINAMTGGNATQFQEDLKSGVLLCQLINRIAPGSVAKVNMGKAPFVQMENIGNYLDACVKFGVRSSDNFVTKDLFDGVKLNNVSDQIYCLSDVAVRNGYSGPALVEKYAGLGGGVFSANTETVSGAGSPAAPVTKPPPPAQAPNFGQMCPSCGINIGVKAKFCPECGERMIV